MHYFIAAARTLAHHSLLVSDDFLYIATRRHVFSSIMSASAHCVMIEMHFRTARAKHEVELLPIIASYTLREVLSVKDDGATSILATKQCHADFDGRCTSAFSTYSIDCDENICHIAGHGTPPHS